MNNQGITIENKPSTVKDNYILCQGGVCEGDQAITDYQGEMIKMGTTLAQSLFFTAQLAKLLKGTPGGKKVLNFLVDVKAEGYLTLNASKGDINADS